MAKYTSKGEYMSKHSRLAVLTAMKQIGIIPVFYNGDFEVAKNVAVACADGGAKCIEFTNRGDRAINVFTKIAEYRDSQKPEMILGVGSICDAATAAMYIAAGADFVVGPVLDEETAVVCNSRKIPYSPGCGSATEIHKAHKLGVEICKVFPGEQVGGPEFVKAGTGPCPWGDIMPTGGVSPTRESLTKWFKTGIVCAGMGSNRSSQELLAATDGAGITNTDTETIELVRQIRG
jgi:2-dehydro-3-deoxyphosphogluconate aldolase/(4S)-4-hydroxy-2-oxoglutarate aldolase